MITMAWLAIVAHRVEPPKGAHLRIRTPQVNSLGSARPQPETMALQRPQLPTSRMVALALFAATLLGCHGGVIPSAHFRIELDSKGPQPVEINASPAPRESRGGTALGDGTNSENNGGGQQHADPGPPTSGGGGTGGSGGGAVAPPPNGNQATIATTGLFDLTWLAGAVPGGPTRADNLARYPFRQFAGIVSAADGDVYICDRLMNQVIDLPATGAPSILCGAGDGSAGYWGEDLPAIASALDTPTGLARDDSNGVLYVADSGNHRIRHFMPAGRIYTMAGGGADPADVVPRAVDAALGEVHGLALDSRRNVYFSEIDTGKVRRVDAMGRLTTLALLAPGSTRAVAASTAGDKLWVAHADSISVLDVSIANPTVTLVLRSPGKRITALAFNQVDTLYYTETNALPTSNGGTLVRAIALSSAGLPASGRAPETIAGSGVQSDASLDYALPVTTSPDARSQALAGQGPCSLYIDLHDAASPSVLSGILYTGNSFASTDGLLQWGQLARLSPLP